MWLLRYVTGARGTLQTLLNDDKERIIINTIEDPFRIGSDCKANNAEEAEAVADALRQEMDEANDDAPPQDDDDEDADNEDTLPSDPTLPPTCGEWHHHTSRPAIQVGITSILASSMGSKIIHAPRSYHGYRLHRDHFRIAFCRRRRLPIHSSPIPCPCGRHNIDIFGDHYFDCTAHPKLRLHDRARDTYCTVLRKVAEHAHGVESKEDVLLEPVGLAPLHPRKRPGDVAFRLIRSRFTHQAVDFTIIGTAPAAPSAALQERVTAAHHRDQEIDKWRGRATYEVEVEGETETKKIKGHRVITDLIANKVVLTPATLDGHMRQGRLLQDLMVEDDSSPIKPLHKEEFGNRESTPAAYAMGLLATGAGRIQGILSTANRSWRDTQGTRRFGATYRDGTPRNWAETYLGVNLSRDNSLHVLRGIRRSRNASVIGRQPSQRVRQAQPQSNGQNTSTSVHNNPSRESS